MILCNRRNAHKVFFYCLEVFQVLDKCLLVKTLKYVYEVFCFLYFPLLLHIPFRDFFLNALLLDKLLYTSNFPTYLRGFYIFSGRKLKSRKMIPYLFLQVPLFYPEPFLLIACNIFQFLYYWLRYLCESRHFCLYITIDETNRFDLLLSRRFHH